MVDIEIADAAAAIVLTAIELENVESLLDECDERQEILALQTVHVKVVGCIVRCCHDDEPFLEQGFEQPAKQHGIRDIADLKLVKAEQLQLSGEPAGEGRNRVPARLLTPPMQRIVDLQHEGMKVYAPLLFER